jgi:hypothetical protein
MFSFVRDRIYPNIILVNNTDESIGLERIIVIGEDDAMMILLRVLNKIFFVVVRDHDGS